MSLSKACVLFNLSRQGIYQQQYRDRHRVGDLVKVKQLVIDIRRQMPRLGTRKIYYLINKDLKHMNIKLGRDGLFKLLQMEGLLIRRRKNYRQTTWSKHWLRKYPNTFKTTKLHRPEQAWVSDITYLPSRQGTFYLSLVTDAYSRKIVGYNISPDLRAEGPIQALQMALRHRRTNLPLVHHSDKGVQYCSSPYQELLKSNNIEPSMTEGLLDCYQNAIAERVNGILKDEFIPDEPANIEDLRDLIHESIIIYNNLRPHLSLNYQTPSYYHHQNNQKPVNVF